MKRAFTTLLGITCCAGSVYAASPAITEPQAPTSWSLNGESQTTAFLSPSSPNPMVQALPASAPSSARQDLGRLALKISYVGGLILTADHIIRSVDSVLDGMEVNRADGTQLKLFLEPGSRGVDFMLRMSRPLDF